MTLKQLLETLKTKNVLVTVIDKEDNELCKIYVEGYETLDDAVEARTVARWTMTGATAISVVINDPVTTPDPDPDPSDP